MNTNSTDFACLVTGFLTDYLPHHRCYSKNTILSYRDTLKLFLRFIKEEKGILLNSFYIRDFKRELVIEFLEWYRNSGAGVSAAKQRLAVLKEFSDYAHLERVDLQDGELFPVARALLPEEIEEGTKLLWENLVYSIVDA